MRAVAGPGVLRLRAARCGYSCTATPKPAARPLRCAGVWGCLSGLRPQPHAGCAESRRLASMGLTRTADPGPWAAASGMSLSSHAIFLPARSFIAPSSRVRSACSSSISCRATVYTGRRRSPIVGLAGGSRVASSRKYLLSGVCAGWTRARVCKRRRAGGCRQGGWRAHARDARLASPPKRVAGVCGCG